MSTGFGEYLVLRGVVSPKAVLHVLKKRSQARPHLGELAARREWLSWGQVLGVLGLTEGGGARFGEVAVHHGLLTAAQVDELLAEQGAATPTLEQCLVDLGVIGREQLDAERARYEASRPPPSESLRDEES